MTIEQIHINNGIKGIASQEVINDVVLYNYYGGILPSEVVIGSYKQEATDTNSVDAKILPRDNTGNIISYVDNSKNKNKLRVNLLTKKFISTSVKYSLDYNFEEFYSNNQQVTQQEQLIETLQQNVNLLLANIDSKNTELNNLKLLDNQKSKSLVDAQNTINGLANQATKIADDLAKIMEENVKSSNSALKDLTSNIKADADNKQKEIDNLKSQIDKLKDDINKLNSKSSSTATQSSSANASTGSNSNVNASTGSNSNVNASTGSNSSVGNTNTLNQSSAVSQVTAAIGNNKTSSAEQVMISKEVTRSEGILNKTNELLAEIAIGQWYKYLKEEPSLYPTFDRREATHRMMLKGKSYNNDGTFIGVAVNNLTDSDIEYLLKIFEKYWKNRPYNNVYSKGIPYTDAEQLQFEKIYPYLKGVRQYAKGPKHFLYDVNIFNDNSIQPDRYKYVKL